MAGTIATINEMNEKNTQSQCWTIGKKFQDGWNLIAKNYNLNIFILQIHNIFNLKGSYL